MKLFLKSENLFTCWRSFLHLIKVTHVGSTLENLCNILRQSKLLIKVLCARTLFKPWFPNSCCSSPPTFTNTWLFVSLSLHLFLSHFYLNSFTYWSLAGSNWKSFRFSFCVLKILSLGSISFAFWIKCFQKSRNRTVRRFSSRWISIELRVVLVLFK